MCDIEPEHLVAEFHKASVTFKPWDVLQWNGMSWDYMTIALVSDGISGQDRLDMARFARKALTAAAVYELGILRSLRFMFGKNRKNKPIEAMASPKDLPPEPEAVGSRTALIDIENGNAVPMDIPIVAMDEHRVRRRRAVTARVLLRLEKDRAWRPTKAEMREIQVGVGARV